MVAGSIEESIERMDSSMGTIEGRLETALDQPARVGCTLDSRHGQQTAAAYLFHDMLRGHHRPLLPTRQGRDLVTDDEEATIRSQQT